MAGAEAIDNLPSGSEIQIADQRRNTRITLEIVATPPALEPVQYISQLIDRKLNCSPFEDGQIFVCSVKELRLNYALVANEEGQCAIVTLGNLKECNPEIFANISDAHINNLAKVGFMEDELADQNLYDEEGKKRRLIAMYYGEIQEVYLRPDGVDETPKAFARVICRKHYPGKKGGTLEEFEIEAKYLQSRAFVGGAGRSSLEGDSDEDSFVNSEEFPKDGMAVFSYMGKLLTGLIVSNFKDKEGNLRIGVNVYSLVDDAIERRVVFIDSKLASYISPEEISDNEQKFMGKPVEFNRIIDGKKVATVGEVLAIEDNKALIAFKVHDGIGYKSEEKGVYVDLSTIRLLECFDNASVTKVLNHTLLHQIVNFTRGIKYQMNSTDEMGKAEVEIINQEIDGRVIGIVPVESTDFIDFLDRELLIATSDNGPDTVTCLVKEIVDLNYYLREIFIGFEPKGNDGIYDTELTISTQIPAEVLSTPVIGNSPPSVTSPTDPIPEGVEDPADELETLPELDATGETFTTPPLADSSYIPDSSTLDDFDDFDALVGSLSEEGHGSITPELPLSHDYLAPTLPSYDEFNSNLGARNEGLETTEEDTPPMPTNIRSGKLRDFLSLIERKIEGFVAFTDIDGKSGNGVIQHIHPILKGERSNMAIVLDKKGNQRDVYLHQMPKVAKLLGLTFNDLKSLSGEISDDSSLRPDEDGYIDL